MSQWDQSKKVPSFHEFSQRYSGLESRSAVATISIIHVTFPIISGRAWNNILYDLKMNLFTRDIVWPIPPCVFISRVMGVSICSPKDTSNSNLMRPHPPTKWNIHVSNCASLATRTILLLFRPSSHSTNEYILAIFCIRHSSHRSWVAPLSPSSAHAFSYTPAQDLHTPSYAF